MQYICLNTVTNSNFTLMDSVSQDKYFKHFKGNYYKFLYEAKHTETGEELVVYQALYGEGKIWVRPKDMFYEEISKDGYSGPRFIPVSPKEAIESFSSSDDAVSRIIRASSNRKRNSVRRN